MSIYVSVGLLTTDSVDPSNCARFSRQERVIFRRLVKRLWRYMDGRGTVWTVPPIAGSHSCSKLKKHHELFCSLPQGASCVCTAFHETSFKAPPAICIMKRITRDLFKPWDCRIATFARLIPQAFYRCSSPLPHHLSQMPLPAITPPFSTF